MVRRDRQWFSRSRRHCLWLGAGMFAGRAAAQIDWAVSAPPLPEPLRRVHAAERGGWLATSDAGHLWWIRVGADAVKLGSDIDPLAPVAAAHGWVVARRRDGRLWVQGGSGAPAASETVLAPHGGFVVLPLGVIGVEAGGADARCARLEPDGAGLWRVVARSSEAVLPDAQPVQVALEGAGGDAGHIAVLAGPDAARYRHGVLGDAVEATRMLYLERHDMTILRELTLPPPHVFEHNRPIAWRDTAGTALVSVRSGPQGAQVALVEADPLRTRALRVAALGEPIGTPLRWLAPSVSGTQCVAVHMPHLAGVLHRYRREGDKLVATRLTEGVSNHALNARELDVSAWLGERFVVADLQRRRLRAFDIGSGRELAAVELPSPLRALAADAGGHAAAALLDDGSMRVLTGPMRAMPR